MTHVHYVKNEQEADDAKIKEDALDYRLAMHSNLGCAPGTVRLTFLHKSSFKDHPTSQRPADEKVKS